MQDYESRLLDMCDAIGIIIFSSIYQAPRV